ncbi:TIGR04255 family protein [bacterium]|nr:TIGR04255 family protein [bacterium]
MKIKYRNPPIEEALVEFRFEPGQEWDLTIPGKLHEQKEIKSLYTGKPRTQKSLEASFQSGPGRPPNVAVREGVSRIHLVNDKGTLLLTLGTDVMSVNTLKPYDDWEHFKPRIQSALDAYSQVAQPIGISRVGVRYINKIVLPCMTIEVEKYFKYGPPPITELDNKIAGFLSRVEYIYDDAVKLIITQASVEEQNMQPALVLDLDVIWEEKKHKNRGEIMETVDDLHEREGKAFEAMITDAARELFKSE